MCAASFILAFGKFDAFFAVDETRRVVSFSVFVWNLWTQIQFTNDNSIEEAC